MSTSGKSVKERITKSVYAEVLDELLLEKKLEDITTTEIIRRSGMSRTTFYSLFSDKYELANWRFKQFLESLGESYLSPEDADESLKKIIRFVYSNRIGMKRLLEYTGQNSFYDYYMQCSLRVAGDIAEQSGKKLSIKDVYIIRYHAAGTLRILNDWLCSDDGLSVNDITDILLSNRSETLRQIYVVS